MSRNHRNHLNTRRWAAFRRAIFERDCWRCVRCSAPGRLECHHPHRLEDGGAPYDPGNARAICRNCHIEEHRPDEEPGVAAWKKLLDEIIRGD